MKQFALPEDTVNKVLNYLYSRPFGEVAGLINLVQKATPVVEAPKLEAVPAPAETSAAQ